MIFCGIDGGLEGGIAFLDTEKQGVEVFPMPVYQYKKKKSRAVRKTDLEYGKQKTKVFESTVKDLDIPALLAVFQSYGPSIEKAFLEEAHPRPKNGAVHSFKSGGLYYALQVCFGFYGIPFEIVPPLRWMKALHSNIPDSIQDTKQKSTLVAKRIFPTVCFKKEGAKKDHDGMVEAALIAEFGRIQTFSLTSASKINK